jgi:hypothetical protein
LQDGASACAIAELTRSCFGTPLLEKKGHTIIINGGVESSPHQSFVGHYFTLVLDSCHCLLSSSFEIDMNRFKKKKKVIGYRIFIIIQAVNDSYQ